MSVLEVLKAALGCRGRAEPGGKCPDIGFFAVYGEAKVSHVRAHLPAHLHKAEFKCN